MHTDFKDGYSFRHRSGIRSHGLSNVAIFHDSKHHWGELTPVQRATQLQLKREYEPVAELIRLLVRRAPEDLVKEFVDADRSFRTWIEFGTNWRLSPDKERNDASLRSDAADLDRVLTVLAVTGTSELIIVPDTNSLLKTVDPVAYRSIAGSDSLLFLLLPTVLGELDRLKVEHRNSNVREEAQAAIKRIKGWRQQGTLSVGVTVAGSITVRAQHEEPDMKNTLSWLDSSIQDDRIIASIIALQAAQPSSRIVLVMGDINLQNKADAALIETAELP
jgi:hypothetical protein